MSAGLPRGLAIRLHAILVLRWLVHELPKIPRSWWECNVGLWPPVKARRWLRHRWWEFRNGAYHIRWCIVAAVMNRVATQEMRHAALLLGYDYALGHGRERLLGHLHEFSVGNELGCAVRYGDSQECDDAIRTLLLELSMFRTAKESV